MLKKGLKLAHWIWTISTLAIAGFWFVHHGGTNWFPVSVAVVSKAIADTVDTTGIEVMNSSEVASVLHADAINIAAQLGRMDMAALAMTIISVVFAILGIFGFMHLKDRAEFIAKKTTEECFEKYKQELTPKIEQHVASYMEEAVADIGEDYAELMKNSVNNTADEESIAPGPDEDLRGGVA